MNEDQLNDLKQFIAATVSQAASDMATKGDIAVLGAKIDGLDLKVNTISDALTEQLNDHDIRLTKLEQQTA